MLGAALVALCSGVGQFGVVAALGDVAKGFGHLSHGTSFADEAGLSGTTLGLGLAVIRLASLGGLPLAGLADRWGRRASVLATAALGLALTAVAAVSPSYWAFVAIFACGRPLLSATNAVAQVCAAEQTGSADRAKAVALVAAGYGVGAGAIAVAHSLLEHTLGFRWFFALALVPLVALSPISRLVGESDRFEIAAAGSEHPLPVLGVVAGPYRRRLALVAFLTFALSVITGPANSFVFLYAENVLHQAGAATAAMVTGAGVTGLCGLVVGRWIADHLGRRAGSALGMVAVAGFGVLTYSGSTPALVVGYLLAVLAGGALAPSVGAIVNELFPTEVRASVAGWCVAAGVLGAVVGLVAFGSLADVGHHIELASIAVFLPAALAGTGFFLLPETRGREPEEVAPAV